MKAKPTSSENHIFLKLKKIKILQTLKITIPGDNGREILEKRTLSVLNLSLIKCYSICILKLSGRVGRGDVAMKYLANLANVTSNLL